MVDFGMGLHPKIGTVCDRMQKSVRGTPPPPALLRDFEIARAFIVAAIEIAGFGDAIFPRRFSERVEQLPSQSLTFDPHFAAGAVNGAGTGKMILGLHEIWQNVVPAPPQIPGLPPSLIVRGLPAHVNHAIDRRRASEDATAGIIQSAAIELWLWFGSKAPVGPGIAHAIEVADRHLDPEIVVPSARFQQ